MNPRRWMTCLIFWYFLAGTLTGTLNAGSQSANPSYSNSFGTECESTQSSFLMFSIFSATLQRRQWLLGICLWSLRFRWTICGWPSAGSEQMIRITGTCRHLPEWPKFRIASYQLPSSSRCLSPFYGSNAKFLLFTHADSMIWIFYAVSRSSKWTYRWGLSPTGSFCQETHQLSSVALTALLI